MEKKWSLHQMILPVSTLTTTIGSGKLTIESFAAVSTFRVRLSTYFMISRLRILSALR